MKKYLYVIALIGIFFSFKPLQASHMAGGEITWRCLPNGQYQFYMELFRKCDGALFTFSNQTIHVVGGPVTSFIVKPDSNRWLLANSGLLSPKHPTSGAQMDCHTNPNREAYQFFPFKSDPITLNGIPPASGWEFYWILCCKPDFKNLANPMSDSHYLKSVMYPYNNQNNNPCFDSSPRFIDKLYTSLPLSSQYALSQTAMDINLDSLVFEFDDLSTNTNVNSQWNSGYNKNSPLPGTFQDTTNINVNLDSQSGHINGMINSPSVNFNMYGYSVRVDAYRGNTKIASVWRNVVVNPVPPETLNTNVVNTLPEFTFNNVPTDTYNLSVFAGDQISVNIMANDNDLIYDDPNDPTTLRAQKVSLRAKGFMFSNDFTNTNDCAIQGIAPCATMTPPLAYNSLANDFFLTNSSQVNSTFQWQPSCALLSGDEHTFNFVFSAMDDNAPPRLNFATMSIEVSKKTPTLQVNGNTLTLLDSANSYQWYHNDTLLPNSNTQSITMHSAGTYSVKLGNGCLYKKAVHNYVPVSIKENALQSIQVYPNPSTGEFKIELPNELVKDVSINVVDINGKLVNVRIVKGGDQITIDANSLSNGIYFLNISSSKVQSHYKLIKMD